MDVNKNKEVNKLPSPYQIKNIQTRRLYCIFINLLKSFEMIDDYAEDYINLNGRRVNVDFFNDSKTVENGFFSNMGAWILLGKEHAVKYRILETLHQIIKFYFYEKFNPKSILTGSLQDKPSFNHYFRYSPSHYNDYFFKELEKNSLSFFESLKKDKIIETLESIGFVRTEEYKHFFIKENSHV